MSVRGHGDAARLKPPICAIVDSDAVIIQRGAEHRFRQGPFADRQRPAGFMRAEHALAVDCLFLVRDSAVDFLNAGFHQYAHIVGEQKFSFDLAKPAGD